MTTQVIILNGGSSSGKSGIARCLQAVLPDPWLAFGTDTLTEAMPASMQSSAAGIQIAPDGEVSIGLEFRALEAAWIKTALAGLQVLWVGVQCEGAVAAGREVARGDRVSGMAASQAEAVHRGVAYDMEVDTTHAESMQCARAIAARAQLGSAAAVAVHGPT